MVPGAGYGLTLTTSIVPSTLALKRARTQRVFLRLRQQTTRPPIHILHPLSEFPKSGPPKLLLNFTLQLTLDMFRQRRLFLVPRNVYTLRTTPMARVRILICTEPLGQTTDAPNLARKLLPLQPPPPEDDPRSPRRV